jgi:hypothetical protein
MGNSSVNNRISAYISDAEEHGHLDLTAAKPPIVESFPWSDFLKRDAVKSLRRIDLVRCQLTVLPPIFGELQFLEVLRFADNRIRVLPQELFDCFTLEVLNFNANQIKEIPENISRLTNLTELQFSNNEVQTLPRGIENLRKLKSLNIDKNHIDFASLSESQMLLLTAVAGQYYNQRSPQEILPGFVSGEVAISPDPQARSTNPLLARSPRVNALFPPQIVHWINGSSKESSSVEGTRNHACCHHRVWSRKFPGRFVPINPQFHRVDLDALGLDKLTDVLFFPEFDYLLIDIGDAPWEDIKQYFPNIISFIDNCFDNGGKVLVHCVVGASRSAAAVTAYLMKKQGMRYDVCQIQMSDHHSLSGLTPSTFSSPPGCPQVSPKKATLRVAESWIPATAHCIR